MVFSLQLSQDTVKIGPSDNKERGINTELYCLQSIPAESTCLRAGDFPLCLHSGQGKGVSSAPAPVAQEEKWRQGCPIPLPPHTLLLQCQVLVVMQRLFSSARNTVGSYHREIKGSCRLCCRSYRGTFWCQKTFLGVVLINRKSHFYNRLVIIIKAKVLAEIFSSQFSITKTHFSTNDTSSWIPTSWRCNKLHLSSRVKNTGWFKNIQNIKWLFYIRF